ARHDGLGSAAPAARDGGAAGAVRPPGRHRDRQRREPGAAHRLARPGGRGRRRVATASAAR
ncbi:MAG: hypothetical protein AVDCRST_MAG79-495, partial [uncultured Thermoleophilia bacterium]